MVLWFASGFTIGLVGMYRKNKKLTVGSVFVAALFSFLGFLNLFIFCWDDVERFLGMTVIDNNRGGPDGEH